MAVVGPARVTASVAIAASAERRLVFMIRVLARFK
jgi:hypothetical protein